MTEVGTVLVSGLPGSGKSSLGRAIAGRLGYRPLDKDDVLEALFETASPSVDRATLSRIADERLIADALEDEAAVVVSFWRRPEISTTSGTRSDWLTDEDDVVELVCDCPPELAVERFRARQRHRRHGDARRRGEDLLRQFAAIAELGPLGVGRPIRVDTAGTVDLDAVIAAITRAPMPEPPAQVDLHRTWLPR